MSNPFPFISIDTRTYGENFFFLNFQKWQSSHITNKNFWVLFVSNTTITSTLMLTEAIVAHP